MRNGNVRGDTTPPSGQLERLIQVIRAAAERGLMVDVSFARETVPNLSINNYIKGITRAATLLRPYRNVLFDLQNEHDNASPGQALSIAEMHLRLRNQIVANSDPAQGDPGRVLVTSGGGTPAGAVAFARDTEMHANAFHGSRESDWQDTMTSAVTGLLAGNKPVYLQEPQAWDSGLTFCNVPDSARGDRVPGHFRTAARTAKAAGAAAWTFHTRQGFDLRNTSLKSRIQADAVERELLEGTPAVPSLAAEVSATSWPVGVTLTVDLPGSGTGTVTASGSGLTCTGSGVSCSATFSFNETVTLTASTADGMTFLGWGGACSQAAACTVTVDGDRAGHWRRSAPFRSSPSRTTTWTRSGRSARSPTKPGCCSASTTTSRLERGTTRRRAPTRSVSPARSGTRSQGSTTSGRATTPPHGTVYDGRSAHGCRACPD